MRRPVRVGTADARVGHAPGLAHGFGREDVRVIRVQQRAARQVAIHHHLEDVVVQIGARKVPVVVVSLIEEIEAVETLHPSDLDLDVHVLEIVVHAMAPLRVHQLVHADGVAVGHHGPIVGVPVDARDHVGRELEYLERDVLPLHPRRGQGQKRRQQKKTYSYRCHAGLHVREGTAPLVGHALACHLFTASNGRGSVRRLTPSRERKRADGAPIAPAVSPRPVAAAPRLAAGCRPEAPRCLRGTWSRRSSETAAPAALA